MMRFYAFEMTVATGAGFHQRAEKDRSDNKQVFLLPGCWSVGDAVTNYEVLANRGSESILKM